MINKTKGRSPHFSVTVLLFVCSIFKYYSPMRYSAKGPQK